LDKKRTDPAYKLKCTLRNRIYYAIKKGQGFKSGHSQELLGCDFQAVKEHLESLFTEGMSWDNHGQGDDKWHIDHIIPCASFDLTDPEEQRKCFHYTNLQPLWQPDNLSKGDRIL
jgi:hypothetical protein